MNSLINFFHQLPHLLTIFDDLFFAVKELPSGAMFLNILRSFNLEKNHPTLFYIFLVLISSILVIVLIKKYSQLHANKEEGERHNEH